jgi:hypothetical protein
MFHGRSKLFKLIRIIMLIITTVLIITINNYLEKIFRIFANSANKRQTTVTIDQILTQQWFLLQNTKKSSLNLEPVKIWT